MTANKRSKTMFMDCIEYFLFPFQLLAIQYNRLIVYLHLKRGHLHIESITAMK